VGLLSFSTELLEEMARLNSQSIIALFSIRSLADLRYLEMPTWTPVCYAIFLLRYRLSRSSLEFYFGLYRWGKGLKNTL